MRRPLGGFGVVALAIVVAVVLLLAARAWNAFGPTAAASRDDAVAVPEDVRSAADGAARDGSLPRLDEVRERTDARAGDVREALAAAD